jgi:integrase
MSALPVPVGRDLAQLESLLTAVPQLADVLGSLADPQGHRTVAELVTAYLADAKPELAPETYRTKAHELKRFTAAFGTCKVRELTILDVKRWLMSQRGWRSGNKRAGVRSTLMRLFNWCVSARLIKENPLHGLQYSGVKLTGREMKQAELQAVLRSTDPYFRRFLMAMRWTGARPGELCRLTWPDVRWEQSIAVMTEHKTANKTQKPRILVFTERMMRMLEYIRRTQAGPCAVQLRRLLENAPGRRMLTRDVVAVMKARGWSYRSLYRARNAIGAEYVRAGGWGEHGRYHYFLRENAVEQLPEGDSAFVFLSSKRKRWDRHAVDTKFRRLKKRLGLPADCKVHGLRHTFISECIRRGLNLKTVSTLAGHADTRCVDKVYAHLGLEDLRAAAEAATAALRTELDGKGGGQ